VLYLNCMHSKLLVYLAMKVRCIGAFLKVVHVCLFFLDLCGHMFLLCVWFSFLLCLWSVFLSSFNNMHAFLFFWYVNKHSVWVSHEFYLLLNCC
jgi:hypothetical protein